MKEIKVLSVTSEIYPLIKTGGLADVAGALPAALASEGVKMRSLVPGYPAVIGALTTATSIVRFADLFGGTARLLAGKSGDLDILALDAPHLYNRPGNPYVQRDGTDWPDNAQRFAALSYVAAWLGQGQVGRWRPDIVHAHDWQAALAPLYMKFGEKAHAKSVLTVHNLAFQGRFAASLMQELQIPPSAFTVQGVEYYGDISFLKGGLQTADHITTVSPTYATEILSPAMGMGLDGVLNQRARDLSGILNGLDGVAWDSATDPYLPVRYKSNAVQNARRRNRQALQERLGLRPDPEAMVLGVISRLSAQKGLDLLLELLPQLLAENIQLALLGAGDATLQQGFARAAAAYPSAIGCAFNYDEPLAHLIQGGADAFLVPSRFEPCGLTQLAALRYGAVPIVSRVGGLADTIIDANPVALAAGVATGIQFGPTEAAPLMAAIRRAVTLWRDPKLWRKIQANGMATDVSWKRSAHLYAKLYADLITN